DGQRLRPPPGPRRKRGPRGRKTNAAGNVLIAMLVGFLVWLLLAGPALKRAAVASPVGARRTAPIVVLAPLDTLSRALGLSRIDAAAESALGRNVGGNAAAGEAAGNGKVQPPPPGVDATHPSLPPATPTPQPARSVQPGDVTPPPPVFPPTVRRP